MIGGRETPTAPLSLAHSSDLRDSSMLIKGGTAHQRKRPSPSRHISATHRFQLLHSASSTSGRSVAGTVHNVWIITWTSMPKRSMWRSRRSTSSPSRAPMGVTTSRPSCFDRSAISSSVSVGNRNPRAWPLMIHHCVCGSVGCAAKTGRYFSSSGSMNCQVRSVSTTCESESMTRYFVSETRPLSAVARSNHKRLLFSLNGLAEDLETQQFFADTKYLSAVSLTPKPLWRFFVTVKDQQRNIFPYISASSGLFTSRRRECPGEHGMISFESRLFGADDVRAPLRLAPLVRVILECRRPLFWSRLSIWVLSTLAWYPAVTRPLG